MHDSYLESKIEFETDVDHGFKAWFGDRKARGNEFRDAARLAWQEGLVSWTRNFYFGEVTVGIVSR